MTPPVVIDGHGDGNGIGLGQWGAFGYATGQHRRWQWIVRHYYEGTYLRPLAASAASSDVHVVLSELDGASATLVRAVRPGAHVVVNNGWRPRADTVTHTGLPKVVHASAGDISVDLPGVGWRDYQGSLVVEPDGTTMVVVPLEEYVSGVVPAESPASWGAVPHGMASLQAQAVAARSYALAYVAAEGAICDTDWCQVYDGDVGEQGLGVYTADVRTAVFSTLGEVMCLVPDAACPLDEVALTQFGASSGGWTLAAGPFQGVVDAGDAVAGNPFHTWSSGGSCPTTFPEPTVARAFGLVSVSDVWVSEREGNGVWGGRAVEVVAVGLDASGATQTVTEPAAVVVSLLGLCSTWFHVAQI